MDKKFCIKRFIGVDECGDVFIYNYPPNIKGESPNRCLVSNGTEEKIYDAEGGYIDHDTDAFTPYDKAEYLTMAEDEYKKFNAGDSWEDIVVADNYEKYDALVDNIKNYYAQVSGNEDVAYEVEDIVSQRFIELLGELDKKFK